MEAVLIMMVQGALVGLAGFLVFRVYTLYRQRAMPLEGQGEQNPPARPLAALKPAGATRMAMSQEGNPYQRADWMAQAQIFAGIQMLDSKRKGLQLPNRERETIQVIAGAYLAGAADAITASQGGGDPDADDLAAFLLSHNLQMDSYDVQDIQARVLKEEVCIQTFQEGREAAGVWLEKKFVPDELSLFEAVSGYAFL